VIGPTTACGGNVTAFAAGLLLPMRPVGPHGKRRQRARDTTATPSSPASTSYSHLLLDRARVEGHCNRDDELTESDHSPRAPLGRTRRPCQSPRLWSVKW
jgi:hypothetical protein